MAEAIRDRLFLLRSLHLFGLDDLDPVVLAALADERPMLLIGAHGTGKSELLNRLAAALGLEHRHFNASLISFDDLLGYPVPDAERKRIEFIETPASVWGAESVFLDEISRCRPETQNKLFSLVHERRIQGIPLPSLRYCWAAMNPPPPINMEGEQDDTLAADEPGDGYAGAFPLDRALADRFAYIVRVPRLYELSADDRRRMLGPVPSPETTAGVLTSLVEAARRQRSEIGPAAREWIHDWVVEISSRLRDASLPITGRRTVMLAESVESVWAACQALRFEASIEDAALIALRNGLPQRASGIALSSSKLLSLHRTALANCSEARARVWKMVSAEADPVRRLAIALSAPANSIDPDQLGLIVTDAYSQFGPEDRYLIAHLAAGRISSRGLTISGPALETIAKPLATLLDFAIGSRRYTEVEEKDRPLWTELTEVVSGLQNQLGVDPDAAALINILHLLFGVQKRRFSARSLVQRFFEWREIFRRVEMEIWRTEGAA